MKKNYLYTSVFLLALAFSATIAFAEQGDRRQGSTDRPRPPQGTDATSTRPEREDERGGDNNKRENPPEKGGTKMNLDINPKGEILVRGNLLSVSASSLTLSSWGITFTVNTDSDTEIVGGNSLADFTVGHFVGVKGRIASSTSGLIINAKVVRDWNPATKDNNKPERVSRDNASSTREATRDDRHTTDNIQSNSAQNRRETKDQFNGGSSTTRQESNSRPEGDNNRREGDNNRQLPPPPRR